MDTTSQIDHFKRNYFNRAIADIYRALDGKSIVGSFILTFCVKDSLAWIEFGGESQIFSNWIAKRLLPLSYSYTNIGAELYSVRNGLLHCYGPSEKIIKRTYSGYELMESHCAMHLQRLNSQILKICLYSLITDVVYAAHLTFEDLKQNATSEQIDRLNRQIKNNLENTPELYADMHSALSYFDSPGIVTLDHVKSDYTAKILYSQEK